MASRVSDILAAGVGAVQPLALYGSTVEAGFPSPADDYIEGQLDLNEYLIRHPAATFFVRVSGESMRDAGIFDGDLLLVDRALEPRNGQVVVAALSGELTVKRICWRAGRLLLVPDGPGFAPIEPPDGDDFHVWGVVTYNIHRVQT